MVKATNLLIKKEHDLFCLVAGGQALCAACAARARGAARARPARRHCSQRGTRVAARARRFCARFARLAPLRSTARLSQSLARVTAHSEAVTSPRSDTMRRRARPAASSPQPFPI